MAGCEEGENPWEEECPGFPSPSHHLLAGVPHQATGSDRELVFGRGAPRRWSSVTAGILGVGLLGCGLLLSKPRTPGPPKRGDGDVTGLAIQPGCAPRGVGCLASKCCQEPGMACYAKTPGWAMCRPNCPSGVDPVDTDPHPWDCEQLGTRTPGIVPTDYWGGLKPAAWVQSRCAALGDNCYKVGCCKDPGLTCFAKNEIWASCKATCRPGPDPSDTDSKPWLCVTLGFPTPGAPTQAYRSGLTIAPWVATTCAGAWENCLTSRCCKEAGMTCYQKDAAYAGCKASCRPGPDYFDVDNAPWTCKELGPATPGVPAPRGPVKPWVIAKCSGDGGNCASTKCCSGAGMQCYAKNELWATCTAYCAAGVHNDDPDKSPWSCKKLGVRNPGNWQHPSLFCWALTRSVGEEASLIKSQWTNKWSLFRCEEWSVYSDTAFDLGGAWTTGIGDLTAQKGKWGSWLNTVVFVKAWHQIYWTGQYKNHDWTVKVDPDAAFFPDKLKAYVAPIPTNEAWCIHNSLTGTLMLGPIEILNRVALEVYFQNNPPALSGTDKAVCENPYMDQSGEDGFISGCLQRLGVKAKYDGRILKNNAEDCTAPGFVTFHPCKTLPIYKRCMTEAVPPLPPPPPR